MVEGRIVYMKNKLHVLCFQDEDEAQPGDYHDIARHGIIEVAGDDVYGRKVIVFSACKLPPKTELNHQRLFE